MERVNSVCSRDSWPTRERRWCWRGKSAGQLRSPQILPVDLFRGCLQAEVVVAPALLGAFGVDVRRLDSELFDSLRRQPGPRPEGHIPFAESAKRVLEQSLRQALKVRQDHIGSEHLLLALLVVEEPSTAPLILGGVTAERLGTAVKQLGVAGRTKDVNLSEAEATAAVARVQGAVFTLPRSGYAPLVPPEAPARRLFRRRGR